MRIQRAPRAAAQPQPAPADGGSRVAARPIRTEDTCVAAQAAPGSVSAFNPGAGHTASLEVDVTSPAFTGMSDTTFTELLRRLRFACVHEGLLAPAAGVIVAAPTAEGLAVTTADPFGDRAGALPDEAAFVGTDDLVIVHAARTRVQVHGDWGLEAPVVATISGVSEVLVPVRAAADVAIARRQVVRVALTTRRPGAAHRSARALEILAEAFEAQP